MQRTCWKTEGHNDVLATDDAASPGHRHSRGGRVRKFDVLRSAYVETRSDYRATEADRSHLLTVLASLEATLDAVRSSAEPDQVGVGTVVSDLDATAASWSYDRPTLLETGLADDRPRFADFGVEHVKDVGGRLHGHFKTGRADAFHELVDCLADAVAGGGEAFVRLERVLHKLVRAFEDGNGRAFADATNALVDGFQKRDVRTREDLRRLLEAQRGVYPGEYLLDLQADESRTRAVEAIDAALEAGDAEAFLDAVRSFELAGSALETLGENRREALQEALADITGEYSETPTDSFPGVDGDTPVLLLPTRLETRFRERTDDGQPVESEPSWELLVRVYPDDVHVDTHERALTDAEIDGGLRFWELVWWASHHGDAGAIEDHVPESMREGVELSGFPADAERRHAAVRERAWNRLVERFGPERAAWVKREMAPSDGDALLEGPDANGHIQDADADAFRDELDDRREAVDRRPASWTRPPRARLLPDRWVAFAKTTDGERTITSEPVAEPLSVGPDPGSLAAEADQENENPKADFQEGEMEWVFDFEVAEEVGMGLRIPLTADEADEEIEHLLVIGVATALDEVDAAADVADLLEAHHYTDGLAMLERGTPTNDTRDDPAATSPTDPESIYERECERLPVSADDVELDGVRAARLLGLDPSTLGDDPFVFERVTGADRTYDAAAEATNAALWSATLGYTLPHLFVPRTWETSGLQNPAILRELESARRHFVAYVRGGGPLPPLRVGDQPYGVVPATATTAYERIDDIWTVPETDVPDEENGVAYQRYEDTRTPSLVKSLLDASWSTWNAAIDDVPSVESADDPSIASADLLSMSATSYGYRLRDALNGGPLEQFYPGDPNLQTALQYARSLARSQLARHSEASHTPRVGDFLLGHDAPIVDTPVVNDDLAKVLEVLQTSHYSELRGGPPTVDETGLAWYEPASLFDPEHSLTALLCYNALLEELRLARVRFADHWEHWDKRVKEEKHDEEEHDPFTWRDTPWTLVPEPQVYDADTLTMWEALDHPVDVALADEFPLVDGDQTVGELLQTMPNLDRPLAELLRAFEYLQGVDPGVLGRLVRETLDVASHRYDAWATSLATRRLHGMREQGSQGVYVGAYGYVERLERDSSPPTLGYVHAPSIDQATAAAVMRSAHEAEHGEYGDLFAVDLSADRVRDAMDLLEGVRGGFPLGELLGYRFERALHEADAELDEYVYTFRALTPLVEGKVDREDEDFSGDAAEREVVDGAALYDLWREKEEDEDEDFWELTAESSLGPSDLPSAGTDARKTIRTEILAIEESLDAVSDVLAAESVYQLVRDEPERAGAALDALSRGESPGDLEVVETPRTGTSCTHRLVALVEDADESNWNATDSPRGVAEPGLEDWAGTLLGDPGRVVCRAAWGTPPKDGKSGVDAADEESDDPDDGAENDAPAGDDWTVETVCMSDLDLAALDVVSLVEGDADAWGSELESRIGYHLRRTRDDVTADDEMRLSFAAPADWPDVGDLDADPGTDAGVGELLEVASAVGTVVSDGRPVDGRDLSVPGETSDDGRIVGDLDDRAKAAEADLDAAVSGMEPHLVLLDCDEDTDERAVDDLLDLANGLRNLSTDRLATAESDLGAIGGTSVEVGLTQLDDAASGTDVLVERVGPNALELDAAEPTITGLAQTDVQVTVTATDGTDPFDSTTVDASDGRFSVTLDPEALPSDAVFGVEVDTTTVSATFQAELVEDPAERYLVEAGLAEFAATAQELLALRDALEPLVAAATDLDGDVLDDAVAALDAAAFPPEAEAALTTVRDLPDAKVPGAATPVLWERLAPLLAAVHDGTVDAPTVENALDSGAPTDTDLADDLETGVGDVANCVAAAEAAPDDALIAGCLEVLRANLLVCADYGIDGSVPISATGSAVWTDLVRQAASVAAEASDRVERSAEHRTQAGSNDPDAYVSAFEVLFGEAFTVLVPFEPPNAEDLDAALDADHGDTLQGGDPLSVEEWFARISRIRESVGRFGRALTYGETFGDRSPADGARFAVGQLPYDPEDTWVGLPEAWEDEHPSGRLSIVAHRHGTPANGRLTGLFVDEFVETVPNEGERTGLSIHYDGPSNQAPQTMLLAVPPTKLEQTEGWSPRALADVVLDTIELAKARTVDHDALDDLGHLLPGVTFTTSETERTGEPDTVSVDPQELLPPWAYLQQGGGGS